MDIATLALVGVVIGAAWTLLPAAAKQPHCYHNWVPGLFGNEIVCELCLKVKEKDEE